MVSEKSIQTTNQDKIMRKTRRNDIYKTQITRVHVATMRAQADYEESLCTAQRVESNMSAVRWAKKGRKGEGFTERAPKHF